MSYGTQGFISVELVWKRKANFISERKNKKSKRNSQYKMFNIIQLNVN